jgi:hypothetical protein
MPTQPQGCWDHWAACKPIERSDQPVKRAISKKRKRKEKKRKEKKASSVLEAMCDHHLWFWHTTYSYSWTLNDLNGIAFERELQEWLFHSC